MRVVPLKLPLHAGEGRDWIMGVQRFAKTIVAPGVGLLLCTVGGPYVMLASGTRKLEGAAYQGGTEPVTFLWTVAGPGGPDPLWLSWDSKTIRQPTITWVGAQPPGLYEYNLHLQCTDAGSLQTAGDTGSFRVVVPPPLRRA
jgi:hypothetical protein